MLQPFCARWAYGSGTDAHPECARLELMRSMRISVYPQHESNKLMRALSMHVRNWCVRWAYKSGTGVCTEHTHQVLMRAQNAFPSKNAEHTHQELMRTLSIRVRNWCLCWACASVPDADAQHAHQFLTCRLNIKSIKIPNLKEVPIKPCWAYG
jgi:hypothetical protein